MDATKPGAACPAFMRPVAIACMFLAWLLWPSSAQQPEDEWEFIKFRLSTSPSDSWLPQCAASGLADDIDSWARLRAAVERDHTTLWMSHTSIVLRHENPIDDSNLHPWFDLPLAQTPNPFGGTVHVSPTRGSTAGDFLSILRSAERAGKHVTYEAPPPEVILSLTDTPPTPKGCVGDLHGRRYRRCGDELQVGLSDGTACQVDYALTRDPAARVRVIGGGYRNVYGRDADELAVLAGVTKRHGVPLVWDLADDSSRAAPHP